MRQALGRAWRHARRPLRWLLWVVLGLAALPIVLILAVLIAANTRPGQAFIAAKIGALTDGLVTVSGLTGSFPQSIRVRHIGIADARGVWLTVENAALDWSPSALLAGDAHVTDLAATRVTVARLPVSQASKSEKPFELPLPVDVDHTQVGRLDIGAPVIGTPATLQVDASAHLEKLFQGRAALTATDLDPPGINPGTNPGSTPGTYHVEAELRPASVDVTLQASEPVGGLAARIAKLPPQVGALAVQARVDGPRTRAGTILTVTAGQAHADAHGTLDLDTQSADLILAASAAAMTPAPGVSFQSATLAGHVQGTLAAPRGKLDFRLRRLQAANASVADLAGTVDASPDGATLTAQAQAVRLPGAHPDLLASAPVLLSGKIELKQPGRPATFSLSHPLLDVRGEARTAAPLSVTARLQTPDLTPLAALAGVDLQGQTALVVSGSQSGDRTSVTLGGTLGITGGPAPAPALIGPNARIDLAATLQGQDVSISRFALHGRAVTVALSGGLAGERLDATTDVTLPDLHAAAPTVRGKATLHAHAAGALTDLALQVEMAGDVATRGAAKSHVEASVVATGVPAAPSARLRASGRLDGSPLSVDAQLERGKDGTVEADISRADWKGAHADARFSLAPGATLPSGAAAFRIADLADFRRLSGLALTGRVDGTLAIATTGGRPVVTTNIRAERAGLPGQAAIQRLALDARVDDPLGALAVDATLAAEGIRAGAIAANAHASVAGRQTALAIRADASASGIAGGPAQLATRATVNLPARTVALSALDASARGATVRLLAPARIAFGPRLAVDRLRLGLREAALDVAGRVSPTLDLTASLHNATADLVRIVDPSLRAQGTISADARLTGTPGSPSGTLRLAAHGLHLDQGSAAGLPPASITADATLAGRTARINANLAAGTSHLAISGIAPIAATAALDLRATGAVNLAMADPILTPAGRRARGTIALDATVTGSLSAPRASGSATLTGGSFEDLGQGVRLSDLGAVIDAQGDHVTLTRLTGRAGSGTLSASGSVGLAAPRPVDLRLVLDHAQPIANDILTAVLNADLSVRGALAQGLAASGRVSIDRANITVPDKLPSSVAVLDVRVPGQKKPPPPAPPPPIALDVTLSAPAVIFVRGHGLDAVLRGDLHAGGTAAQPRITGGFTMINGTFSFAGANLTFTTGEVTFDGSGKLDPVLDFVASSTSGSVTANLEVTGYASNPKIVLSSSPPLPQDEVLAHLLFGQPASSLSPFQLGEIALALAQLTGGPGAGLDPLGAARKALGLDRLQVVGGSGGSTTGATLQAGQYVAPGIYVGAAQGTGGSGSTQAQVQIDITKGLKLNTTVGTGGGSATGSSQAGNSGSSIGLTYQFQY